ncbi:DEAD/DEAH box helicase, partial [Patescibacteria group bacterium]|nr:DEAD/DEAH box helicase [Patescibacteria group bacterium]
QLEAVEVVEEVEDTETRREILSEAWRDKEDNKRWQDYGQAWERRIALEESDQVEKAWTAYYANNLHFINYENLKQNFLNFDSKQIANLVENYDKDPDKYSGYLRNGYQFNNSDEMNIKQVWAVQDIQANLAFQGLTDNNGQLLAVSEIDDFYKNQVADKVYADLGCYEVEGTAETRVVRTVYGKEYCGNGVSRLQIQARFENELALVLNEARGVSLSTATSNLVSLNNSLIDEDLKKRAQIEALGVILEAEGFYRNDAMRYADINSIKDFLNCEASYINGAISLGECQDSRILATYNREVNDFLSSRLTEETYKVGGSMAAALPIGLGVTGLCTSLSGGALIVPCAVVGGMAGAVSALVPLGEIGEGELTAAEEFLNKRGVSDGWAQFLGGAITSRGAMAIEDGRLQAGRSVSRLNNNFEMAERMNLALKQTENQVGESLDLADYDDWDDETKAIFDSTLYQEIAFLNTYEQSQNIREGLTWASIPLAGVTAGVGAQLGVAIGGNMAITKLTSKIALIEGSQFIAGNVISEAPTLAVHLNRLNQLDSGSLSYVSTDLEKRYADCIRINGADDRVCNDHKQEVKNEMVANYWTQLKTSIAYDVITSTAFAIQAGRTAYKQTKIGQEIYAFRMAESYDGTHKFVDGDMVYGLSGQGDMARLEVGKDIKDIRVESEGIRIIANDGSVIDFDSSEAKNLLVLKGETYNARVTEFNDSVNKEIGQPHELADKVLRADFEQNRVLVSDDSLKIMMAPEKLSDLTGSTIDFENYRVEFDVDGQTMRLQDLDVGRYSVAGDDGKISLDFEVADINGDKIVRPIVTDSDIKISADDLLGAKIINQTDNAEVGKFNDNSLITRTETAIARLKSLVMSGQPDSLLKKFQARLIQPKEKSLGILSGLLADNNNRLDMALGGRLDIDGTSFIIRDKIKAVETGGVRYEGAKASELIRFDSQGLEFAKDIPESGLKVFFEDGRSVMIKPDSNVKQTVPSLITRVALDIVRRVSDVPDIKTMSVSQLKMGDLLTLIKTNKRNKIMVEADLLRIDNKTISEIVNKFGLADGKYELQNQKGERVTVIDIKNSQVVETLGRLKLDADWQDLKLIDGNGEKVGGIEIKDTTEISLGRSLYAGLREVPRKGWFGLLGKLDEWRLSRNIESQTKKAMVGLNNLPENSDLRKFGEAYIKNSEEIRLAEISGETVPKAIAEWEVSSDRLQLKSDIDGNNKAIDAINKELLDFQEYADIKILDNKTFTIRGESAGDLDQSRFILNELFGLTRGDSAGTIYEAITGIGKTDVIIPLVTALRAEFFGEVQTVLFPTSQLMKQFTDVAIDYLTVNKEKNVVVVGNGDSDLSVSRIKNADVIVGTKDVIFKLIEGKSEVNLALVDRVRGSWLLADEAHETLRLDTDYRIGGDGEALIETVQGKKMQLALEQIMTNDVIKYLIEQRQKNLDLPEKYIEIKGEVGRFSRDVDRMILIDLVEKSGLSAESQQRLKEAIVKDSGLVDGENRWGNFDQALRQTPESEAKLNVELGITAMNKTADVLSRVKGTQYGMEQGLVTPYEVGRKTGRRFQDIAEQLAYNIIGAKILDENINLPNLRASASKGSLNSNYSRILKMFKGFSLFTGSPEQVVNQFNQGFGIKLAVSPTNTTEALFTRFAGRNTRVVSISNVQNLVFNNHRNVNASNIDDEKVVSIIYVITDLKESNEVYVNRIKNSHQDVDLIRIMADGRMIIEKVDGSRVEFFDGGYEIGGKRITEGFEGKTQKDVLKIYQEQNYYESKTEFVKVYELGAHVGVDTKTYSSDLLRHITGDKSSMTIFKQGDGRGRAEEIASGEYKYADREVYFNGKLQSEDISGLRLVLDANEKISVAKADLQFREKIIENSVLGLINGLETISGKRKIDGLLAELRMDWEMKKAMDISLELKDLTAEQKLQKTVDRAQSFVAEIGWRLEAEGASSKIMKYYLQNFGGSGDLKVKFTGDLVDAGIRLSEAGSVREA